MLKVNNKKCVLPISKRAREIQGSPIRKLAAIAEERKKQGIHVYHLNIGQPDLPTPETVFNMIKSVSRKTIEYAPSNGLPEALTAWKRYFEHYGIHFDESEMIVTTGGSEAIIFAMSCICDPGDEIIVFEPFYTNYNGFASIANVNLRPIPLTIDNGFHLPDEEVIESYVNSRTKAILFCTPSNPTGTVYKKEEIERLVSIAERHGLYLLSDEAYREFVYEGKMISIADFPSVHDRSVILDSCSKRFNVCGSRIGVLATHNKDIISSALRFAQARLSVATIDQISLVPLLENPSYYAQPIVDEFKRRRDVICSNLHKISGVTLYKPEGAFYMIVGLPVKNSDDFCRWLIEEFDDKGETVLIAPGCGFYATPNKGLNEVRIAYVLESKHLERALEIITLALEKYRNRKIS